MTTKQRQVLKLYEDGLTQGQIATLLGRARETINRMIARARRQLASPHRLAT